MWKSRQSRLALATSGCAWTDTPTGAVRGAAISGQRSRAPAPGHLLAFVMPPPIISLSGLSKVFRANDVETRALSAVTLSVAPGEFVSIAGPSGCGKTTLLSILGLLDSPTAGRYLLNGRAVEKLSATERAGIRNRSIGFIFQTFNLIGDLTVFENVELPLTYRGVSTAERHERIREVLERVGMTPRMSHYPSQLSGGQQQRVAVARAMVGRPTILLADEPTGNLDSKNGHAVMELLGDLHGNGATICMVTHDPRYAHAAERTIHLFDGRIVDGAESRASHELEESGFELA